MGCRHLYSFSGPRIHSWRRCPPALSGGVRVVVVWSPSLCRVESESLSGGVRVVVEWSPSRCRVESKSLSSGVRVVVGWSPSRRRVESESLSGGVRVVVGWSPSRCRVESESLSSGVRVVVLDEPRRGISQTSCPPPQSLPNQRRLLTKQKATRGGGGPAESAGFALPND